MSTCDRPHDGRPRALLAPRRALLADAAEPAVRTARPCIPESDAKGRMRVAEGKGSGSVRSMDGTRSLDEQRREFAARRFLAMPLAGTLAWAVVALGGLLAPRQAWLILFIATGSIAYIGMGLSKLTGEDFLDKTRPKNAFDSLFFHTVGMALLVYGIAIPFFLVEPSSLPLSVGVLSGVMWVPVSWFLNHWIGYFHAGVRTAAIVAAWYVFPEQRFVVIPLVIIAVYSVTIVVLERRWRAVRRADGMPG